MYFAGVPYFTLYTIFYILCNSGQLVYRLYQLYCIVLKGFVFYIVHLESSDVNNRDNIILAFFSLGIRS